MVTENQRQENGLGTPLPATDVAVIERSALLPIETEIAEFGRLLGQETFARQYLLEMDSPTKTGFRQFVLEELKKRQGPLAPIADPGGSLPVGATTFARTKVFKDGQKAFRFLQWYRAIDGNEGAIDYCKKNNIALRSMVESQNSKGGFLVPEEFLPEMINLLDSYGVARMEFRVIEMKTDSATVPTLDSGFVFMPSKELKTHVKSTPSFGQIELKPKKFSGYASLSQELSDDAALAVADILLEEIMRAAGFLYDDVCFNGDGSSSYNGIYGLRARLRNPEMTATLPTIANCASLVLGSGNAWSELVLSDFINVLGRLRKRFKKGAKWYVSPTFWETVMKKLALAANGTLTYEIIDGIPEPRFLGYPVIEVEVMPTTEANSQVCCIFGNLMMGGYIGDRQEIRIKTSEEVEWLEDGLATKASVRFDFNAFGCGNVNSDAALRKAGPIIGLITAAS